MNHDVPDMKSSKLLSGFIILGFVLLCLFPLPASALSDQPSHIQNVLVLNSYHPTFVWTASQSDGMIFALGKSGLNLSISVEYLDWKNFPDNKNLDNVTVVYRNKYGSRPFDAILTTDDAALNYVIGHRSDIFGDAPVVFSGVNNYALLTPAQRANITGKTEEISPEKTLSSVFMVFPSTNRIYILYEDTETGRGIADRIRDAEPSFRDRTEFIYITNITFDEMAATARTFPAGSVIVSAFTRDRNGMVMDHDRVMALLKANAPVPVFTMYDMAMGYGAIGGSILSGQHEGEIAGAMAVRILRGEPITAVPVNTGDTTIYMFDQDQLDRFSVPDDRLPAGSTVINRVPGLLDQYFVEVVVALLVIIILTICVLVLTFNIRKRKKAEVALAESEKKYRNILESIHDIFYRADQDGNLVMVSPSGAELFGFDTTDELIGMNLAGQLYLNPDDRKTFLAALEREGIVRDYEVTLKRRDGTPITISTTSHIYYGPDGTPAGVEGILRDISSRKKAEDALRESERKIRAVFDQTYEFIGLMTPSGILIDANRSALEFAGIPESAVIGKPFWETPWWSHSPELQQKVRDAVAACAQGGFVRFEATHLAPDGSTHYIDFSLKPVREGECRVIWLIPEGRDITERKRAETALRVSEEKYSKTFQSSPDLILLTSIPEGKILEVNGSILRITGYRQEEVLGRTTDELGFWVDDADREHYKARVRNEGRVMNFLTRFRQRSGAIITAWISGSIVSLESGPCFISVVNDITDWKKAEDALRESEEKYRTLVETTGTGFVIIDTDGRVLDANLEYIHLSGHTGLDEIIGRKVTEWTAKDDREKNVEAVWQCIREGFIRNFEVNYADASGQITPIEINATVLRSGTTVQIHTLVRDITDRRRMENALQLARSKINLLNTVTFHDIQNAAFSISAYHELLRMHVTDEKAKAFLEKQRDFNQTIVNSLNFAKNFQDMGVRPPQWQNIGQVFLMAISHLDFLRITRNFHAEGLEVYADPLLEKVFFHLMQNVLIYGQHATEVTISYQEKPDGLTLFIEDNGIGIPTAEKHVIFDRGYGKGTGLGLFFVREVLSITGMTITETGEPGTGARFEIFVSNEGYRFGGNQ